jgi:hypothetical protein
MLGKNACCPTTWLQRRLNRRATHLLDNPTEQLVAPDLRAGRLKPRLGGLLYPTESARTIRTKSSRIICLRSIARPKDCNSDAPQYLHVPPVTGLEAPDQSPIGVEITILIIVPKSRTTEKKVFRSSAAPRAGIFRGSNAPRAHPLPSSRGSFSAHSPEPQESLFRDRSPLPRSSTFFGQQFVEHFPICRSFQLVRIGDKSVQNRCWPLNIQRSGRSPFMAT